jgi:hypothetical protein
LTIRPEAASPVARVSGTPSTELPTSLAGGSVDRIRELRVERSRHVVAVGIELRDELTDVVALVCRPVRYSQSMRVAWNPPAASKVS